MSAPPTALSAETVALVGIVVPAVVAATGFVARQLVQIITDWRRRKEQRRARLHELASLLQASRTAFNVQRDLANRLAERLYATRQVAVPKGQGLEALFAGAHKDFDPEEADLHGVIRAYTEHALCPLNEATLAWLEADTYYRTTQGKKGDDAQLAGELNHLQAHLLLWRAKYRYWIPERPEHALVYLADETEHGLGFPRGIEDTLARVISSASDRASGNARTEARG